MVVAGIICEYNPLHKGHRWMMEEVRRQGMNAIVCAMSGNFVQRGEAAVADKFARAEMAGDPPCRRQRVRRCSRFANGGRRAQWRKL